MKVSTLLSGDKGWPNMTLFFVGLALLVIFVLALIFPFVVPASAEVELPASISVKGKEKTLKDLKNPFRSEPANLKKYIREGGEVYFKNCYLCHGDLLDGAGLFGDRFFPQPVNLRKTQSTLPESYAYWRIMKGGRGLPDKLNPWDSAMPTWEDTLTEDQVWKVILFIYETAESLRKKPAPPDKPSVERGKELYLETCAYCHGEIGNGDGHGANFSSPRPRKLTKGLHKFRTTPYGKIPSDQDIFNIISKGMPGTTMPAWDHLPESDRWSLVLFLKTLSSKFENFYTRGETLEIITPREPSPSTPEGLVQGKELFIKNCSGCHGLEGRSDGEATERIVNIDSDALWPRNLTKPWMFRRGNSLKDLYTTIRTGLSGTSMPRFTEKTLNDQQAWNLLHYVKTLAISEKRPEIKPIRARKITGSIAMDPEDPAWNTETYFFPLGSQIIQPKKLYHTVIDSVMVKALYNAEEMAIHLSWDDPTFDPSLKSLTSVKESPPPPLSPETQQETLQGMTEEKETNEESEKLLPDAIAVQFPVDLNGEKPYFLNGDAEHPVNLWKWSSNPMEAIELNARGMDKILTQPKESQNLASKAIYRYGSYHLVLKRKLTTQDKENDIQFKPGQQIPIAFNIWDGSANETGTQKAISSWFQLILE